MSARRSTTRVEWGRSAVATLQRPSPREAVLGTAALGIAPDADETVRGVEVARTAPGQAHEPGPLKHDRTPSWGGAHNGTWTTFADEDTNGPQTPERGATCAGGTPGTGDDPAAA